MKPYIESREGAKYEFARLTRKQKINIQSKMQEMSEEKLSIEKLEDVIYTLLKYSYPDVTREQFEDILDYNEEEYGFEETYEMLGYIIEDVFTQAGGEISKKENPYLVAKRMERQNK